MTLSPEHINVFPDQVLLQSIRSAYQTPSVLSNSAISKPNSSSLPPHLLPPPAFPMPVNLPLNQTLETHSTLYYNISSLHLQTSYYHQVLTNLPPEYFLNLSSSSVLNTTVLFPSFYHLPPRIIQLLTLFSTSWEATLIPYSCC